MRRRTLFAALAAFALSALACTNGGGPAGGGGSGEARSNLKGRATSEELHEHARAIHRR